MSVESGFEGKDYVCGRLISHLLEASHDVRPDVQSFQLLESVLFRVQLSVFTGRQHNALSILKVPVSFTCIQYHYQMNTFQLKHFFVLDSPLFKIIVFSTLKICCFHFILINVLILRPSEM